MLLYKYLTSPIKKELISKISIYNELSRYNIIKKLIKEFLINLLNLNNKLKFLNNIKFKFFKKKIIEYVQIWCWTQYSNPTIKDSVIPYVSNENYNFDVFLEALNYMLKTNLILDDIKDLINNIKILLKKEYLIYIKKQDKIIIISKIIKKNNVILFCNYNNKSYNINIYKNLYNRLYKKYKITNKNTNNIDIYIYCLYFRYAYLDSENQQLAIYIELKNSLKKLNINFELFGSAINTLSDNYCSLFYDIEKFFGSSGNFFDIKLIEGIYWCNPPYINDLMYNTALKLINYIKSNKNIGFLVTIPIWDNITQQIKLSNILKNNNINISNEYFKDYPIYYTLKPYIKYELIIPKYKIPCFNFKRNKSIYAVDTYLLFIYDKLDSLYYNKIINELDIFYNKYL